MSHLFKDKPLGHSNENAHTTMPVYPNYDFASPFAQAAPSLSDSDLRETAYEIIVAACRSSGLRPLTYIPQSERTERQPTPALTPSLQRSLTSTAASKVKKALGMKSAKKRGADSVNQGRVKRAVTTGELVRVQMRVTEQTDSRIRRALLRIASGQLGKRIESMVLPLELLQQLKSSDFPNQQEYEAWKRRHFKLLEAGLLLHPHLPLDNTNSAPQRFRQIIHGALERPLETGKNSESMQVLRNAVMSLACRSLDGSVSEKCHWADGLPLNLRIYQMLLEACFDVNEETSVIEEVDEVLELIKKTWGILGIDQMLHNLCFCWILFHRYVATGQVENDLIYAANNLLVEVEKDAKATKDADYSQILSSILSTMLGWAEKKLLAYHDTFQTDNIDSMQSVVSVGILAATMLVEDVSQEYPRKKTEVNVARDRVDSYIRSSLQIAFAQASFLHFSIFPQKLKKVKSSKRLSKSQQNHLPLLSILAQDASDLAFDEKVKFSPILKRWHPLAAGTAVATLHSCYGNELKQFVSGISELTPDAIQVLLAADRLEKNLVQIAVEDSVDSEDGGKSIIREMPPYEAEAVIANLVKSWISTRVDRLKEWVDRNLQLEVWNPRANKERFAPSAVEVLRIVEETLEAFFMLPIPSHLVLLLELLAGLDTCLQQYILKAKSGCGSRNTFIPTLPALTRCATGSKFGVFKRKEKLQIAQRRKSQVGTVNGDNSFGIPQLCCRVNTFQHIRTELEVLEKRIVNHIRNSISTHGDNIVNEMEKKFQLSASACVEGIQQLCEAAAYKVIFHDLSHVLWDGLYVHDRVRTRAITDIMKASFEGFLLVLLAGGPSRAFTLKDSEILKEDFKFLMDLFWSNGDGLPTELIDKYSTLVKRVLPLYHNDTENLIEQFKHLTLESYGSSAKSRLPLPPTTGQWSPTEPNTVLRVLCYRSDEIAAKFLKKTYNLPKKL
ncbi:hypothetical protein Patl1_13314 [Pistacia atlantica]|uniref:Uncharacterized protein n=1 Tax=Pistacia atlantica TaxID=434234 RepID=A0ACC1AUU9_9ROSI|nr:hypothetical protein Patl1_13314 [Pistacia atlantica]